MDPPTAAVESRRGSDDPLLPTIDAAQRVGNDKQRRGHQSDQRNETSRVGDERLVMRWVMRGSETWPSARLNCETRLGRAK